MKGNQENVGRCTGSSKCPLPGTKIAMGEVNPMHASHDAGGPQPTRECAPSARRPDCSLGHMQAQCAHPESSHSKHRRRWLRFSMRTLLLFMLAAAVFSAWLGKNVVRSHIQRPIIARIAAAGGSSYYDYQVQPGYVDASKAPPGSFIVRAIFGDDIFATVNVVFLNAPSTTDADVTQLHELSDLLDVSLRGSGVTDKCVDDLVRIRHLRSFGLNNTSITPRGLKHLSRSKTLQSLSLYGACIGDAHVQQLQQFPNLRFLQIVRTSVSDVGMQAIGSLVNLRTLDIMVAPAVTDNGIRSLGHLKDLVKLTVLQTRLTDGSLPAISRLHALKVLILDGHPITDAGLACLGSLSEIQYLRLSDTRIGDQSLATISKMRHLQRLVISGTAVSDDGMLHIRSLPELQGLDIGRTAVTDAGLERLAAARSLTDLDVGLGTRITIDGVNTFKTSHPKCVVRCWKFSPNGSGVLAKTR